MGRAFVFGDGINTDMLAPGHLSKLPPDELARHCLESIDPLFASSVSPGDVVVAGANFGQGSSREQAAISLKLLGVSAVVACSFARIFYRNAINVGLAAVILPEARAISAGDEVSVDFRIGAVYNRSTGTVSRFPLPPPEVLAILEAGGLIPLLERRFASPPGPKGASAVGPFVLRE